MFEPGHKYGNRFSSTNQPKKNGRKPSQYKLIKAISGKKVEYEMEQGDYNNVCRFLLEQDFDTLKELYQNPKTPSWIRTRVAAMIEDVKRGRSNTVEMLLDRVFGKAIQPIQGNITNINVTDADEMTDEEIDAELARLEKQLKD